MSARFFAAQGSFSLEANAVAFSIRSSQSSHLPEGGSADFVNPDRASYELTGCRLPAERHRISQHAAATVVLVLEKATVQGYLS